MARPRAFNPDQALEKVRDLFWQNGYEGTSMADLLEATGLSRSSIYETFGDKETLFVKTLQGYREAAISALTAFVENAQGHPREDLRILMEAHFPLVPDHGQKGCYMVNAGVELGPRQPQWKADYLRHQDRIAGFYARLIARAQAQDLLKTSLSPEELGHLLYSLVTGLQAKQRVQPDRQCALAEIERFFELIFK